MQLLALPCKLYSVASQPMHGAGLYQPYVACFRTHNVPFEHVCILI